jgi:integrase
VRRKGHKSVSETFPTKAQAVAWARKIEAEMDAKRFQDVRGLANLTLKMLITRYREEIGVETPFGRNKKAVLAMWEREHGDKTMAEIDDEYLIKFVKGRRKGGASGVRISIDLTYLGAVIRVAEGVWKHPVSLAPIEAARAYMALMKISTKSEERVRRPTEKEIVDLCNYLDEHSSLPMRDLIHFAIESAMRIEEITLLRWAELNEEHRTIMIRNRKHPRQKKGNDQEVPLLGKTFEIVMRQPRPANITPESRIFPMKLQLSVRSSLEQRLLSV